MFIKTQNILFILLSVLVTQLFGQNTPTFFNNGETVFINENAIVRVNGGLENTKTSGLIQNEGLLEIANSDDVGSVWLSSNSTLEGSGKYRIEQDWVNNANFIADESEVELFGSSADQLITGDSISTYYDLTLSNTTNVNASKVKRMTLNAFVSNVLNINDRELATDSFTMFVTNPDIDAVYNTITPNNEGYVSSLYKGSLARKTNSKKVYYFPVGSSLNQERYRPVEITPNTNEENYFTVRLANNNATNDGFSVDFLDAITNEVNPFFYHRINRIQGQSTADIRIFYDPFADGEYNGICQWDFPNDEMWNDVGEIDVVEDFPYFHNSKLKVGTFITDEYPPFILSNNQGFFIPNVFTPNGDGINDVFRVQHAGILSFNIEVFNRWGTKVWEAESAEVRWDGRTTAGIEASEGVYHYILKAKTKTKDFSRTGTVTLLR